MRKGKMGYLDPEQLTGERPDARADVYACGVLLWELMAGRRLFGRGREIGSRAPRLDEVVREAPGVLVDVCSRALAHDRTDRYPSALDMWRDLEGAARSLGGPMPPVELGRWVERLVGEDVKNLRRLAANALRDGRAVDTLDRPTFAPEATSYTLRPGVGSADRRRLRPLRLAAAAVLVASFVVAASVLNGAGPNMPSPASNAARPGVDLPEGNVSRGPFVRVVPNPQSARVRVDDAPIPSGDGVNVGSRGRHRVDVDAPGFVPRTLEVDVQDDMVLQIDLAPATTPQPEPWRTAASPLLSASAGAADPPAPRRTGPRRERELDRSDPW
jgi:hypothetical protein